MVGEILGKLEIPTEINSASLILMKFETNWHRNTHVIKTLNLPFGAGLWSVSLLYVHAYKCQPSIPNLGFDPFSKSDQSQFSTFSVKLSHLCISLLERDIYQLSVYILFLTSFFFYYFLSSYTRRRLSVESACV